MAGAVRGQKASGPLTRSARLELRVYSARLDRLGRLLFLDARGDQAQAAGTAGGDLLLVAGVARLVVLGVLVDVPQVVQRLASDDVLGAQHRRHHGVVL